MALCVTVGQCQPDPLSYLLYDMAILPILPLTCTAISVAQNCEYNRQDVWRNLKYLQHRTKLLMEYHHSTEQYTGRSICTSQLMTGIVYPWEHAIYQYCVQKRHEMLTSCVKLTYVRNSGVYHQCHACLADVGSITRLIQYVYVKY